MVRERDPKGIPMYKILAFLKKKKEAKTITEISEEAFRLLNPHFVKVFVGSLIDAVESNRLRFVKVLLNVNVIYMRKGLTKWL